jgi:hypothetical protein
MVGTSRVSALTESTRTDANLKIRHYKTEARADAADDQYKIRPATTNAVIIPP